MGQRHRSWSDPLKLFCANRVQRRISHQVPMLCWLASPTVAPNRCSRVNLTANSDPNRRSRAKLDCHFCPPKSFQGQLECQKPQKRCSRDNLIASTLSKRCSRGNLIAEWLYLAGCPDYAGGPGPFGCSCFARAIKQSKAPANATLAPMQQNDRPSMDIDGRTLVYIYIYIYILCDT